MEQFFLHQLLFPKALSAGKYNTTQAGLPLTRVAVLVHLRVQRRQRWKSCLCTPHLAMHSLRGVARSLCALTSLAVTVPKSRLPIFPVSVIHTMPSVLCTCILMVVILSIDQAKQDVNPKEPAFSMKYQSHSCYSTGPARQVQAWSRQCWTKQSLPW